MKSIVFLYAEMMPYMEGVIRSLANDFDCKVHVVSWDKDRLTPYEPQFEKGTEHYHRSSLDFLSTVALIEKVNPSLLFVSGRMDKMYLKVAKRFKGAFPVVSGIDTQWEPGLKSIAKIILSKSLYKAYFTHLWVPGERQFAQARALGYAHENIINNLYTCDVDLFNQTLPMTRGRAEKKLLFIGRLASEKSFDLLVNAWKSIPQDFKNGWTLTVIGEGSLRSRFDGEPGINFKGFLSQEEIRVELNQTDAFILPSKYEPWGVVVHEVAAAGRMILCSSKVGAVNSFLIDGYNGFLLNQVNEDSIVNSLHRLFSTSESERVKMGQNSKKLAERITPKLAAASLMSIIQ